MNPNTELTTTAASPLSMFHSAEAFELLQRQAEWISKSDLLPKEFKGKPENCGIAMEMAIRLGAGYFQIIQNLAIIHGRPSFSATFLMAMINASGRFSPLEYVKTVTGPEKTVVIEYEAWEGSGTNARKVQKKLNYTYIPTTCVAVATDLRTGKLVEGPPVSFDMAIEEGWVGKSGSKWQTAMRDLMLIYRAGSFFSRVHASDMTLGMQTTEELRDTGPYIEVEAVDVTPASQQAPVTTNPHRASAPAPTPAAEPAPAAAAASPTRPRSGAKATPAGKAKEEPAKPAPAAEPTAPAQRGEIVFYEGMEILNGTSAKGPWKKYTLAYSKPDGTTGHASTFSDTIVEPMNDRDPGTRIAIETKPSGNEKYYPTLSWLEVLEDAAPADDKAPFKAPEDDVPY